MALYGTLVRANPRRLTVRSGTYDSFLGEAPVDFGFRKWSRGRHADLVAGSIGSPSRS